MNLSLQDRRSAGTMNNAVTSLEYRYKIIGSLRRKVYTGKCTLGLGTVRVVNGRPDDECLCEACL